MELNILLLANGLGVRFRDSYPNIPKPLIRYQGKELIKWTFESIIESGIAKPSNIIVVSSIGQVLRYAEQILGTKVYRVCKTNSPAETLLKSAGVWGGYSKFYTVDCDVYFRVNNVQFSEGYYLPVTLSSNRNYSYVSYTDDLGVVSIKEKEVISDSACVGIYPFCSSLMKEYFASVEYKRRESVSEIYLSELMMYQITKGLRVKAILTESFKSLGTPRDLMDDA